MITRVFLGNNGAMSNKIPCWVMCHISRTAIAMNSPV